MAILGHKNNLSIVRKVDFGFYLDGENLGEILMPKRYITENMSIGDKVEVFVYLDGEERYVATTESPIAQVGEYAFLKVNKVEEVGAFMEWGVLKELLVPFSEQKIKMEEGRSYLIYIYVDKLTDRITGTMKLEKFLDKEPSDYIFNQEVELIIWTHTDFGYKAIINGKHLGILYKNEVYQNLTIGQKINGFIKKVREDDKIDLSLIKQGFIKIDNIAKNILEKLEKAGGFLPYNDKTDPDVINAIFGISKKVFKQSIGTLFKQRIIEINEKGIKKVEI
ncbi:MAG: GntR family transcriptional regulator [Saprospiraceae bacterium]|nr:GntR family transcriptional regulator [Saprospiraceae bacterium]